MNMQQIVRAVSVDYRAPPVPETARAHALLGRCFQRNPVDRPSAGDLAVAFAPGISGARDVVTALCEEIDRLKAANADLAAKVIAGKAPMLRDAERRAKLDEVITRFADLTAVGRGEFLEEVYTDFSDSVDRRRYFLAIAAGMLYSLAIAAGMLLMLGIR